MKTMLKLFLAMAMSILVFSCTDDDPEHYIRVASSTGGEGSLRINSVNIGSLSFNPSFNVGEVTETDYQRINSGSDYGINYDFVYYAAMDSVFGTPPDTSIVYYTDTLYYVGNTNTYYFNSSNPPIDKFRASGLNLWTFRISGEVVEDDVNVEMSIESSLPGN